LLPPPPLPLLPSPFFLSSPLLSSFISVPFHSYALLLFLLLLLFLFLSSLDE
jgi:hypothetical protein